MRENVAAPGLTKPGIQFSGSRLYGNSIASEVSRLHSPGKPIYRTSERCGYAEFLLIAGMRVHVLPHKRTPRNIRIGQLTY
jgi:hypothetical protein